MYSITFQLNFKLIYKLFIKDNLNMIKFENENIINIKGTTVFNGVVKARVCVAEDISEADNLQVNFGLFPLLYFLYYMYFIICTLLHFLY